MIYSAKLKKWMKELRNFVDDALQLKYSYLDGRLITLTVWRLNISVISESV